MQSKWWGTTVALVLVLTSAIISCHAQTPLQTRQLSIQLNVPPSTPAIGSASVIGGHPGPQTYYYWVVSNFLVGNSSPGGPYRASQVPTTLSGSDYVTISWAAVLGATSYDVLRTATTVSPSSACGCAVATGVSLTTANDQSNTLNAYTVNGIDPNSLALTLTNEATGAGASHLILRQGATSVDLSNATAGTVASVFGRIGVVVAANGDYAASQVTNSFDLSNNNALGAHYFDMAPIAAPANPGSGCRVYIDNGTGNISGKKNDGSSCAPTGGGGTPGGSSFGIQYNNGGAFAGITPPTVNGVYQAGYNVIGGVAVAPTTMQAGVAGRAVAGTTDTILAADRASWVTYSSGSAVAVTLPQAGSTGFASNFVFGTKVTGAGAVTITPTTSTIDGAATLVISQGQNCSIASLDGANYISRCSSGLVTAGTNVTLTPTANGVAINSSAAGGGSAKFIKNMETTVGAGVTVWAAIVGQSTGTDSTVWTQAMVMGSAGSVSKLYVRMACCGPQGAGGALVFTLQKLLATSNTAVDCGTISVSIVNGDGTPPFAKADTAHTCSWANGDALVMKIVNNDVGVTPTISGWSLE